MKMLRCLLALSLVCDLSAIAKADPLDFQMVVLDPFSTNPIFYAPFQFTFAACSQGQLPTNVHGSYDGCFSGVNRTGQDWAGLQLAFSNTAPLGSQPASCALDGSTDYYRTTSVCSLTRDGSQYLLGFTSGVIPNNGSFVIAEHGVAPGDFPLITASITPGTAGTTTATPEPGSIWLMSTGISMIGFLFARRRQLAVSASPFH